MVQLLGLLDSNNFSHLKFPLICKKIQRGENVFCLDSSRLGDYLDARGLIIEELSAALCERIIHRKNGEKRRKSVDPMKRAQECRSLIENRLVKNQSELAAYVGVSRAWVSKALRLLKMHHK